MKFKKGEQAKDFTIQDIHGNEVRLSDYRGKKVFLGFFRNVNCPFCNLKVHELAKASEKLAEQNVQMIFFFESSPKLLQKSIFPEQMKNIPLIGDPDKEMYNAYGVSASVLKAMRSMFSGKNIKQMKEGMKHTLKEKDKQATPTLIPADFLIDEQQVIHTAHYGQHLNDHLPLDAIRQFAKQEAVTA